MPIEGAMHGMMKLITALGGVAVKGARVAGRVSAATFSPMTPMNFIPHKETFGPTDAETVMIYKKMGIDIRNNKKNVGGLPVFSTRTERIQSRGGEHTASSRTPAARKSMRGPSAQKKRKKSDFKRYLRRHEDEEFMRYYDKYIRGK